MQTRRQFMKSMLAGLAGGTALLTSSPYKLLASDEYLISEEANLPSTHGYSLRPAIISDFDVPKSSTEELHPETISEILNGDLSNENDSDTFGDDAYSLIMNRVIFNGTEYSHPGNFLLDPEENYMKVEDLPKFERNIMSKVDRRELEEMDIQDIARLSVKLIVDKMDYNHVIPLIYMVDTDCNGYDDIIPEQTLEAIPDEGTFHIDGRNVSGNILKRNARIAPKIVSSLARSEERRVRDMYADDIFYWGKGSCANYASILPHIFGVLCKNAGASNAIITPVTSVKGASTRQKHAWNILIAKDDASRTIRYAAIDSTRYDTRKRKSTLNAFNPWTYGPDILCYVYSDNGKMGMLKKIYREEIDEAQDPLDEARYYSGLGFVHEYERRRGGRDSRVESRDCYRRSLELANDVMLGKCPNNDRGLRALNIISLAEQALLF